MTLTPLPAAGSVFTGWNGGGCSGYAPTCEVTMHVAQTVIATFDLIHHPRCPIWSHARHRQCDRGLHGLRRFPGPVTIALIQVWQDKGQWKSSNTTTTQNHATGCDTPRSRAARRARGAPAMWVGVQVTDVDGRQGSLRIAPVP